MSKDSPARNEVYSTKPKPFLGDTAEFWGVVNVTDVYERIRDANFFRQAKSKPDQQPWDDDLAILNLALGLKGRAHLDSYEKEVRALIEYALLNPQYVGPLKQGELYISGKREEPIESKGRQKKRSKKWRYTIKNPRHREDIAEILQDEDRFEALKKEQEKDATYLERSFDAELASLLAVALEDEDVRKAFRAGKDYRGSTNVKEKLKARQGIIAEDGYIRATVVTRASVSEILSSKETFDALLKSEAIKDMTDLEIARAVRSSVFNLTHPYTFKGHEGHESQDEIPEEVQRIMAMLTEHQPKAVMEGMMDHEVPYLLSKKSEDDISDFEEFCNDEEACFPTKLYDTATKGREREYTTQIKVEIVTKLILERQLEEASRYFDAWELKPEENQIVAQVMQQKPRLLGVKYARIEAFRRWIGGGAKGGLKKLMKAMANIKHAKKYQPEIDDMFLRTMLNHPFSKD